MSFDSINNISICIEGQNGTGKTTLCHLIENFFLELNLNPYLTRKKENKTDLEIFYRKKLKEDLKEIFRRKFSLAYADEMISRISSKKLNGHNIIVDKCPIINTSIYNACMFNGGPIQALTEIIQKDEIFKIFEKYNYKYDLIIILLPSVEKIKKNLLSKIDIDKFDNPDLPIEILYRKTILKLLKIGLLSSYGSVMLINKDISIEETFEVVKKHILNFIK